MQRQVAVFLYDEKIGYLKQTDNSFIFEYLPDYQGVPLSLSFPASQRIFNSNRLFPYFASLAPEGWLRSRFSDLQQIDEQDLFGMLIQNGKNLLGAVRLTLEE